MTTRNKSRISFSEANTLANCEWKWDYVYRQGHDGDVSFAMLKGTAAHELAAKWWESGDVSSALSPETVDEIVRCQGGMGVEAVLDWADWMMRRYAEYHEDLRNSMDVVEHELTLTAILPGTKIPVVGRIDGVYANKTTGELYAVERKTYGRRDRLDYLTVDPQVSLYYWVLQQNGYDITGVMYDGIYTYRWKPEKPTQKQLIEDAKNGTLVDVDSPAADAPKKVWTEWAREQVERHPGAERPVADSFDVIWLDRTEGQVEQALLDLKGVVNRRAALRRKGARPIRNIGQQCNWCSARSACHEALAFPQTILLDTVEGYTQ